jgi:hypothetical protein
MTTALTRSHSFEAPPPGHVDPNACIACGFDSHAAKHLQAAADLQRRVADVHQFGRTLRGELARMTGEDGGRADHILAYVDGHVARLLAALDGDTSPAPFLVAARRPGVPDQPPLPLAS